MASHGSSGGVLDWSSTRHRIRHLLKAPASRTVVASGLLSLVFGINGLMTAKWLGASERGIVVLAWSISSPLLLLGALGVLNAARIVIPDPRYHANFHDFMTIASRIVSIVAVPIGFLGAGSLWLLAGVTDPRVLMSFGLMCGLMTYAAILREALHGAGRHVRAIGTDLSNAFVQLAGATLLHSLDLLTAGRIIMLGLVGVTIQIAMGFAASPSRDNGAPERSLTAKALLSISLPGLWMTLGQWIAWRGDRLLLGLVGTTSEVGVYGAASSFADIATLVPAAISAVLTTRLAHTGDFSLLDRWRRRTMILTLGVAVCVACGSVWFLTVFLAGDYDGGVPAALILAPAALFLASSQLDLVGCMVARDLRVAARVCAAGAVVLVAVGLPLASLLGPTGCAMASFVSYAVMALIARRTLTSALKSRSAQHDGSLSA